MPRSHSGSGRRACQHTYLGERYTSRPESAAFARLRQTLQKQRKAYLETKQMHSPGDECAVLLFSGP